MTSSDAGPNVNHGRLAPERREVEPPAGELCDPPSLALLGVQTRARSCYARSGVRPDATFVVQTGDPGDGYVRFCMRPGARTPEELETLLENAFSDGAWRYAMGFRRLAEIKAAAADTGGQMTIIEVTEPPGAEAPLHVHRNEDEAPGMQRVAAIAGRYGCQVVGDA